MRERCERWVRPIAMAARFTRRANVATESTRWTSRDQTRRCHCKGRAIVLPSRVWMRCRKRRESHVDRLLGHARELGVGEVEAGETERQPVLVDRPERNPVG